MTTSTKIFDSIVIISFLISIILVAFINSSKQPSSTSRSKVSKIAKNKSDSTIAGGKKKQKKETKKQKKEVQKQKKENQKQKKKDKKKIKSTKEISKSKFFKPKPKAKIIKPKSKPKFKSKSKPKSKDKSKKTKKKGKTEIEKMQKKYCIGSDSGGVCFNFIANISNKPYLSKCKNKKSYGSYNECINLKKNIKKAQDKYCVGSNSGKQCINYINNKDNYSYIGLLDCYNKDNFKQYKECIETKKLIAKKQKKYCIGQFNNKICINFLSDLNNVNYFTKCKNKKDIKDYITYSKCISLKRKIKDSQAKYCIDSNSGSKCLNYINNKNNYSYIGEVDCYNKKNFKQYKECIETKKLMAKKQKEYCVGKFNNKDCINFLSNLNNAFYFTKCKNKKDAKNYNTYNKCISLKRNIKEAQDKYCFNFKQNSKKQKECLNFISSNKNNLYINKCKNKDYKSYVKCIKKLKNPKKKNKKKNKKKKIKTN